MGGVGKMRYYSCVRSRREAPILALEPDGAGSLWLGAADGQLARWDGERLSRLGIPSGMSSAAILGLKVQPGQGLWVLSQKGLSLVSPEGRWTDIATPVG